VIFKIDYICLCDDTFKVKCFSYCLLLWITARLMMQELTRIKVNLLYLAYLRIIIVMKSVVCGKYERGRYINNVHNKRANRIENIISISVQK